MDKTFNDFNSKTKIHDDLLNYLIEKTKNESIIWIKDYYDSDDLDSYGFEIKLDMPLKSNKEYASYPIFDENGIKKLVPGIIISINKQYEITTASFKVVMYITSDLSDNTEITITDEEYYSKGEESLLVKLYEIIEDREKYMDDINEEKVWKHISDFLSEQK